MRKGAGTDLWESKESKMPSQLSSIRAIGRRKKLPRDLEVVGENGREVSEGM